MAKVKFGLSNVHIAKRVVSDLGVVSYETPKALTGAVELTLEPQGETSDFFADNIKYFSTKSTVGYDGTLTIAYVPDWFKKDYLGYEEDANGHLVETNVNGAEFGLMFQVQTDVGNEKYAIYNCSCSKPSRGFETSQEVVSPKTSALTISISGDESNGRQCFITDIDNFTSLAIPTFA